MIEDSRKKILIIADDLTGANDTGVQYKKNGFSTIVKVVSKNDENDYFYKYDAVCINADTRHLSSQDAYNEVYGLTKELKHMNINYIYKKVDSLMRGNPAPELEAVMDAIDSNIAIVAPSFPSNKRVLENGKLYISEDTSIDVVKIFNEETKRKAINIPLKIVREGETSLREAIQNKQRQGYAIFVIDALTDEDLLKIKKVSDAIEDKKVLCGSAGFAKQLSSQTNLHTQELVNEEQGKITMIVVGSRSKETSEQVKKVSKLYDAPIILVDADEIRDRDYKKAISDAENNAMDAIRAGKELIIIAITSLFEDFSLCLRNTEEENIKSLRIAKCLGTIVKNIYEKVHVCNIVSTGGDTSLQICNAFEAVGIELEDEIAAGIPIGKIVGGIADKMTIITKSGGFGNKDALVKVIEYLNIERRSSHDKLSI